MHKFEVIGYIHGAGEVRVMVGADTAIQAIALVVGPGKPFAKDYEITMAVCRDTWGGSEKN